MTEIVLLSSHLVFPREGYLEAALHVMGYLKHKHNARLMLDPAYPEIEDSEFVEGDWTQFYSDTNEAIVLIQNQQVPWQAC